MADNWWTYWVPAVAPYAVLLRLFQDSTIGADELELLFLRMYKHDSQHWEPPVFDALDSFSAEVDDYCGDEKLRVEVGGIDEASLRVHAGQALEKLERLAGPDAPYPAA